MGQVDVSAALSIYLSDTAAVEAQREESVYESGTCSYCQTSAACSPYRFNRRNIDKLSITRHDGQDWCQSEEGATKRAERVAERDGPAPLDFDGLDDDGEWLT